jgi:hypothetical protein
MSQYFPSDELIQSIIKISANVIRLPSGSSLRVGGLFYRNLADLDMDITTSGASGLDTGSVAADTNYYMYVVDVAGTLSLVASLDASTPTGFSSYRRVGKIETDNSSEVSVVNADAINDVQESQIETLQLQQSTNTSNISTLQADVGVAQSDITALQSQQGTNTSDIATLQSDVSTAQTDISNLQSQQGTNTSDIATNTSDIATNTGDISALQSDVSTLQTNQGNITNDVTTNTGNISTAQSDISDLQDEFDFLTGHRHDGADSRAVLATDLDTTGGGVGDFLTNDGAGNAVWSPIASGPVDRDSVALDWIDGQPSSPTLQIYTNGSLTAHRYYPFAQGSNQKLFATVRVPPSHVDGTVIRLAVPVYTANTNVSLFYKFDVTAYLVQAGDTATNLSKVSTIGNTNPGTSLADQQELVLFSLTDGSGQISGNTVTSGDLIHITLERATLVSDDITDVIKVISDGCHVTFSG